MTEKLKQEILESKDPSLNLLRRYIASKDGFTIEELATLIDSTASLPEFAQEYLRLISKDIAEAIAGLVAKLPQAQQPVAKQAAFADGSGFNAGENKKSNLENIEKLPFKTVDKLTESEKRQVKKIEDLDLSDKKITDKNSVDDWRKKLSEILNGIKFIAVKVGENDRYYTVDTITKDEQGKNLLPEQVQERLKLLKDLGQDNESEKQNDGHSKKQDNKKSKKWQEKVVDKEADQSRHR